MFIKDLFWKCVLQKGERYYTSNLFSPGAVPVDSKASELKFWTKNDGQVSNKNLADVQLLEITQLFALIYGAKICVMTTRIRIVFPIRDPQICQGYAPVFQGGNMFLLFIKNSG